MRSCRYGFALLEAVVATAIVGFVSIAVLGMLSEQLHASRSVAPALYAAELGRTRLFALRMMPPARLRALPDSLSAGVEVTPTGEFFWQIAVGAVQNEPALLMSTVHVSGRGEFTASTYTFDATHVAATK
jgi:hypothetical protein